MSQIHRMNKLIVVVIAIILSSCYNQKKAQTQMGKAVNTYPILGAQFCMITYPPSTKFIKGDSVITFDTVELKDVIMQSDTVLHHDTLVITKTLPPKVITKLIHVTDTVKVEDKAKLEVCQLGLNTTLNLLAEANKNLSIAQGKATKRGWIMWVLIFLIVAVSGTTIYFKSKK